MSGRHDLHPMAGPLQADADASSSAVHQLQGEVADLEQQAARLEQELAAAASSRLTLEGELAAARADVRSRWVGAPTAGDNT